MPLDSNAPCTVCIPTYNQAEHLRAAIESVIAQTAPVRLLVADDASPDNTAAVLADLQQRHRFRVHRQPRNLGIGANLQWLLRAAETPLIMRLDSDDLLHPEFIEQLSARLEPYPRAGYAHCAVQEIDAEDRPTRLRTLARKEEYQDPEVALRRAVGGYQVAANLLLFRQAALASVDFGAGSAKVNFVEDYDLSVRLADAGWGNVYVPALLASYRMWHAASRPAVDRKLISVRGLTHIFESSLSTAFRRRNWSLRKLRRRRAQLAVANADILDEGVFQSEAERRAMVDALLCLSRAPQVRLAVRPDRLGRAVRRLVALGGSLQQRVKHRLKAWLFR